MTTNHRLQTTIHIPTPLRTYTDGLATVTVHGATVGEVLENLAERYPVLRKHLYNEAGNLRSFVNIYVNDEDIRYLQNDATPISEDDRLSIVPSIAGGCGSPRGVPAGILPGRL